MNRLTGEMIYKAELTLAQFQGCPPWENRTDFIHEQYNSVAQLLNKQLGLAETPTALRGGSFEDCAFVLRYSPYRTDSVTAFNLKDLYDLIKEYVPMTDPDQPRRYKIDVTKNGILQKGTGIYERTPVSTDVIDESGAAQGLNDALYKYAVENA